MIFGRHRSCEIDRAAGNMGMHVDSTGKDDHTTGVDGPPVFDRLHELAIRDAQISYLAVNSIRRVVDLAAGDSEHNVDVFDVDRVATRRPCNLPGRDPAYV